MVQHLHSTKVLLDGRFQEATVSIHKGVIENIHKGVQLSVGSFIELGDDYLMPGLIDPHVHINEPGRTEWEGFDTATKSAAAGGITTLIDMPLNSSPVSTSPENFQKKLDSTHNKLHVNCGFWGGLVPENADKMEALIASGVLGIKAFLTHSGIDDFPNARLEDLNQAMPVIAQHKVPLLVHCELDSPHAGIEKLSQQPTSYQHYLASRPKSWENDAIQLMLELCEKHQCRTHIVHLSSAEALPAIQQAFQKKSPLTLETGQHYLYFNAEDIPDADTRYKCAPPIRERANNEQLWKALEEGIIQFVATDHSPSTPHLKELESGNFQKAWGGIAGLQLALPVLWTKAKTRGHAPEKMAEWLSENVAHFLNFHHKKGHIKKGYDADLMVWAPEESFVVNPKQLHHRHSVSPYEGEKLFGVVKQTYVGGKKVFDKGDFVNLQQGKIILRN